MGQDGWVVPDSYGNGFTTKEILVRMEQKVDNILADHEERLRVAEGSISKLKGAFVLVTILIPIGLALVLAFIPTH